MTGSCSSPCKIQTGMWVSVNICCIQITGFFKLGDEFSAEGLAATSITKSRYLFIGRKVFWMLRKKRNCELNHLSESTNYFTEKIVSSPSCSQVTSGSTSGRWMFLWMWNFAKMHLNDLKHASCAFSIVCFIKKNKKQWWTLSVCLRLICFQLTNKSVTPTLLPMCLACFYRRERMRERNWRRLWRFLLFTTAALYNTIPTTANCNNVYI